MSQQEQWQLGGNASELYEHYLVPAVFGPWAVDLVALATLQPGEHVLDVACGTGVVARLAAQQVGAAGKVIGLDLSPGMLAVARGLPPSAGAAVEWWEGSVVAMPFSDAAFDVVLCQQGLQFFPDHLAALREMHRVLVPGGRLALSVWRPIQHSPGTAALVDALERHVSAEAAAIMRAPFALGDAEELRALVAGAGFRDVTIRIAVRMVRFPSPEEFVRRLVAAVPLAGLADAVARVDVDARAALIGDVSAALRSYVDDEGLAVPMESHVVVAQT